jgi:hypothetical protein
VASVLTLCLPVFFAGIIFIQSFAADGFAGSTLGSNLMGALVGGLLESLSLWTGIKSLLILAALLYAGSLMTRKIRPAVPTAPSGEPGNQWGSRRDTSGQASARDHNGPTVPTLTRMCEDSGRMFALLD